MKLLQSLVTAVATVQLYSTMVLIISPLLTSSQSASFWNTQGKAELDKALQASYLNTNIAKNVIIFIGDGMDITTITSARILKGQLRGDTGEEAKITWDEFPHVALSKTYNTDYQVADSAGTATAMFSGIKTKFEAIGVDESIEHEVCPGNEDANANSFFASGVEAGKSIGLISTARVSHATPASMYAHSVSRYWEYDSKIPAEEAVKGCKDITDQLLTKGRDYKVILGGGRRTFMPNTTHDPEHTHKKGRRKDGRNLINEWLELHDDYNSKYVWNKTEFDNVDPTKTDFLLGLFERSHMLYEEDRATDVAGEPSLAEMTEKAIKILSQNEHGFMLMVEGGGRRTFMPNTTHDPEHTHKKGRRKDGRNLINEWLELHDDYNSKYVWNKTEFDNVDPTKTDFLLGLFERSHMLYEEDRATDVAGEPSLAEMTEKAIKILSQNEHGFMLMVEGGRIDHAHHAGMANRALDEAVIKALSLVNVEETLLIVTADHAHSMTMTGYPKRGNPIFGLNDNELDIHGIPFTTLSYANGPGATEELKSINETGFRRNLTEEETSHPDFLAPALVATTDENHGGQDVAIYALGPMSHLFHSVHEQNYIAHVVRYAACLDEYGDCAGRPNRAITNTVNWITLLMLLITSSLRLVQ